MRTENEKKDKSDLIRDKLLILLYYCIAFIISYLCVEFIDIPNLYLRTLVADIIATLFIYIMSLVHKNTSVYDPYWSVYPVFIISYWLTVVYSQYAPITARQIIVTILVWWWALRLTYNWTKYWQGMGHEDWRYTQYRKEQPKLFPIINFFGLQMMPTLWVFGGCMPIYAAFISEKPFGVLDIIGTVIMVNAILFETISDIQMHRFQRIKKPGEFITTGLWKYSRHPNYFGEVTLWWGIWFFGIAGDLSYWWTVIGPLLITLLFIFVSIPMMEKHNLEKRNGYEGYIKSVSALIPWKAKKVER